MRADITETEINHKKVIGADNLSQLFTGVDIAYGVHTDIKRHTGGGV